MISQLSGTVRHLSETYAVVMVGGVGYKVFATPDVLGGLAQGTGVTLWTYLAVRETALDLYGFATEGELKLFELLLTVTGIGPKSAIGILGITTAESLRSAIASGNIAYLTKVSGIGKKTAEKIVLELKDKMGLVNGLEAESHSGDTDALEALQALGYSTDEARDALKRVTGEFVGANARLKEALKILGGTR